VLFPRPLERFQPTLLLVRLDSAQIPLTLSRLSSPKVHENRWIFWLALTRATDMGRALGMVIGDKTRSVRIN